MDAVIVIAALTLNPIARRKRVAESSEPVPLAGAPVSPNDSGRSTSPEKSDLESGGRPVLDDDVAGVRGSRQG
jgi:hypothetical protein